MTEPTLCWEYTDPDGDQLILHTPGYGAILTVVGGFGTEGVYVSPEAIPGLVGALQRLSRPSDNATDPALVRAQDMICAEIQRRQARLNTPDVPRGVRTEIRGELIGLRAALGMTLGETVLGGRADEDGQDYYTRWVTRQYATTPAPAQDGERP